MLSKLSTGEVVLYDLGYQLCQRDRLVVVPQLFNSPFIRNHYNMRFCEALIVRILCKLNSLKIVAINLKNILVANRAVRLFPSRNAWFFMIRSVRIAASSLGSCDWIC